MLSRILLSLYDRKEQWRVHLSKTVTLFDRCNLAMCVKACIEHLFGLSCKLKPMLLRSLLFLKCSERMFCFVCIYCHNNVIFVRAGGGIGPRLLSVNLSTSLENRPSNKDLVIRWLIRLNPPRQSEKHSAIHLCTCC